MRWFSKKIFHCPFYQFPCGFLSTPKTSTIHLTEGRWAFYMKKKKKKTASLFSYDDDVVGARARQFSVY